MLRNIFVLAIIISFVNLDKPCLGLKFNPYPGDSTEEGKLIPCGFENGLNDCKGESDDKVQICHIKAGETSGFCYWEDKEKYHHSHFDKSRKAKGGKGNLRTLGIRECNASSCVPIDGVYLCNGYVDCSSPDICGMTFDTNFIEDELTVCQCRGC
jgi:hypothetical protein